MLLQQQILAQARAAMRLLRGNGYGPRYSKPKGYRRINRLNRSRHWPAAMSYKEARALSPHPEIPVR